MENNSENNLGLSCAKLSASLAPVYRKSQQATSGYKAISVQLPTGTELGNKKEVRKKGTMHNTVSDRSKKEDRSERILKDILDTV